jgi:casein kinase II subunit beta
MNPLQKQNSIDSTQESRPQSTVSVDELNELSSGSGSFVSWITWYCSLPGNDFLVEVPESWIEDDFNLMGLSSQVPLYSLALDAILDLEREDDEELDDSKMEMIESSAQTLYALIHQRFLNSKSGLLTYKERYQDQEFGTCPRSGCKSIGIIPVGLSDVPGTSVKFYCPRCHDIYNPRHSKYSNIDGCHFGTSFPHNLFVTYPELVDFSLSEYQVFFID